MKGINPLLKELNMFAPFVKNVMLLSESCTVSNFAYVSLYKNDPSWIYSSIHIFDFI